MAVLTEEQRKEVWRELSREAEARGYPLTVKQELWDSIVGVDDGLEANANTINQWFPQPARTNFGARAKAFIVGAVANKRAVGS